MGRKREKLERSGCDSLRINYPVKKATADELEREAAVGVYLERRVLQLPPGIRERPIGQIIAEDWGLGVGEETLRQIMAIGNLLLQNEETPQRERTLAE
jgi:hypothetical protein